MVTFNYAVEAKLFIKFCKEYGFEYDAHIVDEYNPSVVVYCFGFNQTCLSLLVKKEITAEYRFSIKYVKSLAGWAR